jgi:hypothetical protein
VRLADLSGREISHPRLLTTCPTIEHDKGLHCYLCRTSYRSDIYLTSISPHPVEPEQTVASLIPIDRKGKFEDNTLEIIFEKPITDFFPSDLSDDEIHQQMLASAAIEPWKIQFVREEKRPVDPGAALK